MLNNDIETGAFELAKDSLTTSDRLLAQYPDAQTWFARIGHRAVHRIGFVFWIGLILGVIGSFTAIAKSNQSADFTFFTRENVKKDPHVIKLGPHPCGEYALARVSKMPGLEEKGYLVPDKVVEVDTVNKTLRRWAKPIDTEVVAVEGDRILIKADKHYWIKPSGEFQLQIGKIVPKAPTFVQRVKQHPEFKGSGYAGLWRFQDLKTGKVRQVIYEGNCT
jgi:hypothetical protein